MLCIHPSQGLATPCRLQVICSCLVICRNRLRVYFDILMVGLLVISATAYSGTLLWMSVRNYFLKSMVKFVVRDICMV